jgi:ribosome biogenesis GTPase
MSKKKQARVDFRKNRAKPPRANDVTDAFRADADATSEAASTERVRAKGDLSRRRTVTLDPTTEGLVHGRVLRVHGLNSYVETTDGQLYRCAVRRLLKTLATDERNAITTGDLVWFRPSNSPSVAGQEPEGLIEQVEPRSGVLTRASRRREHVLVANVDQLVVVISLVAPDLKPHLIDRYLAAAQQGELAPIVCLNKADLTNPAQYQPMLGHYARIGVPALLTSAQTGLGVERLRAILQGRATVFSGQSGVGKSSLLNAVQPGLGLRVREVSEVNSKGRHTTTAAELIRLEFGGYVVDTPGVRQMQLWDASKEEMEGFFPEFAPFIPLCAFPDCTHTHEVNCAIKKAVARRLLSERRYQSYLGLFHGVEQD